jgi:hypothetical protein
LFLFGTNNADHNFDNCYKIYKKMLSPLARPFHPTFSTEAFQIFNDGIPSLIPLESDIIRGFSDETLDECFPPSAQDAAELEAVEEFVQILAHLEMLEEREERLRKDYDYALPKRWAVRRELQGRPRPARTHNENRSVRSDIHELQIVVPHRKERDFAMEALEHHHSHRDTIQSLRQVKRSNMALNSRPTRPIIQPRKGF